MSNKQFELDGKKYEVLSNQPADKYRHLIVEAVEEKEVKREHWLDFQLYGGCGLVHEELQLTDTAAEALAEWLKAGLEYIQNGEYDDHPKVTIEMAAARAAYQKEESRG